MLILNQNKTAPKKNTPPSWRHIHDEYRYLKILRILSLCASGIFSGLIFWIIFFSYEHIYLTIGKVHNILILKSSASVEVIQFEAYDAAKKAWEDRLRGTDNTEPIKRSPFDDIVSPTTSTSKTQTSL